MVGWGDGERARPGVTIWSLAGVRRGDINPPDGRAEKIDAVVRPLVRRGGCARCRARRSFYPNRSAHPNAQSSSRLNERGNVVSLLKLLEAALSGNAWQVIFVDDDWRDGTADHIRAIGKFDRRARCLQRIGRRGLSTARIEGALASATPDIG